MAQDTKIDWYGHPYLPDGTQDRTRIVPAGNNGVELFAGVGGDVPVDTPYLFGVVDVMQGYTYRAVSVNVALKRQVLAIELPAPAPIPVLLKALAAAQASLTNDADAAVAAGGDTNAPGAGEED